MSPASETNPFPGLRPFSEDDAMYFFGREEQTNELMRRLEAETRFLALVGPSGCGKSSYIRAGIVPALRDFLSFARGPWKIAILRPGPAPVTNLARALAAVFAGHEPTAVEATLRRSGHGLSRFIAEAGLQEGESLLICVDQFEELFRFSRHPELAAAFEMDAFVELLCSATAQREHPIYVIASLRSDFLGDCASLPALAAALNSGFHLMPRLNRERLELAIEGPVRLSGAAISPQVTQRILNDASALADDYLTVVQHALKRTWEAWRSEASPDSEIEPRHYYSVGGLDALPMQAEMIFERAPAGQAADIEEVFRALVSMDADGRVFRRPRRISEICSVTGKTQDVVTNALALFRDADLAFVDDDMGVVDIASESLIHRWSRLRAWAQAESEDRAIYMRLAKATEQHTAGEGSLLAGRDLERAVNWFAHRKPTVAWAEQHHPGFESTLEFIRQSQSAGSRWGFWRRLL